jgi:hypothetical protein
LQRRGLGRELLDVVRGSGRSASCRVSSRDCGWHDSAGAIER